MPDLYVIEKPEGLIGKTIAHIEMTRFCDPLLLTTTDGGIMAWRTCTDEYSGMETDIYESHMVEAHVFNSNTTKKYLIKNNICTEADINKFIATRIEERRLYHKQLEKQREEHDKAEYERLKKKFDEEAANNTKTD
ncbi:MAG: hypothetical protein H6Q73_900 [Firmicutes bacterium]|nr:hypothetical protein [Bacillota bacterium]